MQMMFFRQHFGHLALGMCDFNHEIEQHERSLNYARKMRTRPPEERVKYNDRFGNDFFSITEGGLALYPWAAGRSETRVAVVGEGLIVGGRPRLYAKCDVANRPESSYYVGYERANFVLKEGLPSPTEIARMVTFRNGWSHREEDEVPDRFKELIAEVLTEIDRAVLQGPEFFRQ